MSSVAPGNNTSTVEISHISAHGVWFLAHGKEYLMSYEDFPWFKDLAVKSIINVGEHSPGNFSWPDIDVDLSSEIIEHPENFPLEARIT